MVEIILNGPGKNALGTALMTSVIEQLRAANGAPVLLTGTGDSFSAGLNLKEVALLDAAGMRAFLDLLETFACAIYQYPGPIVAAVNGHAIAGGCIVALCCDHRVATTNPRTKIGLNETALGLRFPPRILAIARRRLSAAHQDRVLLGAELFDPLTAQRLGLVDEVADDPVTAGQHTLTELHMHPEGAYSVNKADLRGTTPADLCPDDVYDRVLDETVARWTGDDVKAAVLRALARRAK